MCFLLYDISCIFLHVYIKLALWWEVQMEEAPGTCTQAAWMAKRCLAVRREEEGSRMREELERRRREEE